MGLDTSHNCWHGSYGGFAAWRNHLAAVTAWGGNGHDDSSYKIPEDLIPDQGPLPDEIVEEDGETYTIRWSEHYPNSALLGHWEQDPEDVLDVLFIHSDCEGVIPHRFCKPLADRLIALAERMPEVPDLWFRRCTFQFADGLLLADAAGDDVDFH